MKKKKQHYVWKHYLKPWAIDNKIWCSREGRIFNTAMENIGQQKYFYKAEPLNENELELCKAFIRFLHPTAHKILSDNLDIYTISSTGPEELRINGIEDYHSEIEKHMLHILPNLYQRDLSFLQVELDKVKFSSFIGYQYSRTRNMHDRLFTAMQSPEIQNFLQTKIIDFKKVSKVISLFLGEIIGSWIYSESTVYFLENMSDVNLITGDQPIINIKASYSTMIEPPKEFELYYPLTPQLAIYIAKKEPKEQSINSEEARKLNNMMISSSHEQSYASKESDLLEIVKSEVGK